MWISCNFWQSILRQIRDLIPEIDFSQLTTFRIEFNILVHCGTLDESSLHPSFMFWKNYYLSHFSSWYFEFTRNFSEVYRINAWLALAPKVSKTKTTKGQLISEWLLDVFIGQKYRNMFVHFLVQMKTFKSHSEIIWPLKDGGINIQHAFSLYTFLLLDLNMVILR